MGGAPVPSDPRRDVEALRRAMYAPGATAADAVRYREAAEGQHAAASADVPPDPVLDPAPPTMEPSGRATRRIVPVLIVAGAAVAVAVLVGALIGPRAAPAPSPTVPQYAVATPLPLSGDAGALNEALAFSRPVAANLAAALDTLLLVRPGDRAPRQATAYALGPWVLALDDLDRSRTARRVTVVVHCGSANRYSWQLDGTWPGTTRVHITATGSGSCDENASAATVVLGRGEAPAQLSTTVLRNRPYVVDVLVTD